MDDEKNWELIRRALRAGAAGDEVAPVTSTRTLFGIKSHAEEVIEAAVREDEARRAADRKARARAKGTSGTRGDAPTARQPAAPQEP